MNRQPGNSGQLAPDAVGSGDAAGVIASVDLRFRSGNSIPVDCARITAEEWEEVKRHLAARQPVGVEPFGHVFRVVLGPEHDSSKRIWAGPGCVFRFGSAPVEGVRGNIQYLNLYTAPPAPAAVPVDASKLERFEFEGKDTSRGPGVRTVSDAQGDWVRFDDVAALLATHPQPAAAP